MIDTDALYPLVLKPVYKEVMWGGNKLETILKRDVPPHSSPIGEAWEIVDRDDAVSIVENGPLKGETLRKLVEFYGKELIGAHFNGGKFPLLVKIIDAGKRLSLQVHPDEAACARTPGIEPKTEMWYIIQADKGAKIIAGLRNNTTKVQFLQNVASPEVERTLQIFDSVPGDAYFIKAGKVHAIGAGNLLLEIQQNSNTTFRISDWGRVDANGKSRELHVDAARDCIDFTDRTVPRISGPCDSTDRNRKYPVVNTCPFFKVEDLRLVENWRDNTNSTSSFHIITAINEPVTVGRDDRTAEVKAGSSCLIPAAFGLYHIFVPAGKNTTVVKTTL